MTVLPDPYGDGDGQARRAGHDGSGGSGGGLAAAAAWMREPPAGGDAGGGGGGRGGGGGTGTINVHVDGRKVESMRELVRGRV